MAKVSKMLKGMSSHDKKRLAAGLSKKRGSLRTWVIIILILLVLFFLAPYFW